MKSFTPLALLLLALGLSAGEPARITIRPVDTGEALLNPGMGWVFHHYDNTIRGYGPPLGNQYAGEDFPGLSVAYLRLAWSYLEPEEGVFNWGIVDGVAQRYIDAGRNVAFRFTCFETEIPFATPEWVKDAGAKGYWWVQRRGCVDGPEADPKARWEPDYDDPLFLGKLERFLTAAAARYDGAPHVAFIDIGSLGVWGEGHPCAKEYPLSTYKRHIDLHFKHFRKTLLVGMDDWRPLRALPRHAGNEPLDYARSLGATMRDDSIIYRQGVTFSSEWMADDFWRDKPVIIESGHYGSHDWGNGSDYFDAIEAYHASYVSIHGDPYRIWGDHSDVIPKMNRRIGYRLQLAEADWPAELRTGEPFQMTWTWRNAGVAPCLPGGFPALTLKRDDHILTVLVDETLDMRTLVVGSVDAVPVTRHVSTLIVPVVVGAGRVDAYVSIGRRDGTPRIALPLTAGDGHRRYRIGSITVMVNGEYRLAWEDNLRKDGDGWFMPAAFEVHKALPDNVRPFGHLDHERRIAKGIGCRLDGPPQALGMPGLHTGRFTIPSGADLADKSFELHLGMWVFQGRRIVSDNGNPDGRVHLGAITYDADGVPTFIPR